MCIPAIAKGVKMEHRSKPPKVRPWWSREAKSQWKRIVDSEVSLYYQACDWGMAQLFCDSISFHFPDITPGMTPAEIAKTRRLSAADKKEVLGWIRELGLTESARRDMKMETEAIVDDSLQTAIDSTMDEMLKTLSKGSLTDDKPEVQ